ncbi:Forkhead associated (FHA) domain, binds pSer, pThr, pTyr [Raineyella antarctica]|uniref:Forkhead associated (FHA) domain, binds pSer, pThr, pTyr n=1 Tax=Raineyella antarctica TaxID=1577474 RepID=A0A1G6GPG7_9ACTN|nr:FHA domain-containing protein [Raineyella antarctica]SDB83834.1 Forkhead associated (FHA) domain, binds pSer, pThr, pTyr [Raineyella antarctica]
MLCPSCGYENSEGSRFCSQCGERLVTASEATKVIPIVPDEDEAGELNPEEKAAVSALPQGSSLLVVRRGPNVGARFLLDRDEITAGRHPHSDVFLDDITVSRHHVKFLRVGDQVLLRDVGSLNGTYVNRSLVDGDILLQDGDEVQIGKFRMVYYAAGHGTR